MKFLNECGYCEPSLSEIRSKNFLKNVASKANKKLAELKKIWSKTPKDTLKII